MKNVIKFFKNILENNMFLKILDKIIFVYLLIAIIIFIYISITEDYIRKAYYKKFMD